MTNNVFIYTLSTCGHCKRAKQLLMDLGVEYDFIDVDLRQGEERTAAIEDVKKYNPACTFPTLIINGEVVVGYKENDIKKALGVE